MFAELLDEVTGSPDGTESAGPGPVADGHAAAGIGDA
jgi:hypothetical protein